MDKNIIETSISLCDKIPAAGYVLIGVIISSLFQIIGVLLSNNNNRVLKLLENKNAQTIKKLEKNHTVKLRLLDTKIKLFVDFNEHFARLHEVGVLKTDSKDICMPIINDLYKLELLIPEKTTDISTLRDLVIDTHSAYNKKVVGTQQSDMPPEEWQKALDLGEKLRKYLPNALH